MIGNDTVTELDRTPILRNVVPSRLATPLRRTTTRPLRAIRARGSWWLPAPLRIVAAALISKCWVIGCRDQFLPPVLKSGNSRHGSDVAASPECRVDCLRVDGVATLRAAHPLASSAATITLASVATVGTPVAPVCYGWKPAAIPRFGRVWRLSVDYGV